MAKASNETFELLHEALAKDLLKRVQDGTATAADLNVARAFLKDNCISSLPTKDSPLAGLLAGLPFRPDEDEDPAYN